MDDLTDHYQQMLHNIQHGQYSISGRFHANEDRLLAHEDDLFRCYAAIDGHGGSVAAQYVVDNLARILMQNLPDQLDQDLTLVLQDAVLQLDAGFCSLARREQDESGACFVALIVLEHDAYVMNCGDCRAVRIHNASHIVEALTEDHKASSPAETKRITESGGTVIQGRIDGILEPSRAIGDIDFKPTLRTPSLIAKPDVFRVKISQGDTILCATDGVWDVLSNDQAAKHTQQLFESDGSSEKVARRIAEAAHAHKNNHDDVSVIAVHFKA